MGTHSLRGKIQIHFKMNKTLFVLFVLAFVTMDFAMSEDCETAHAHFESQGNIVEWCKYQVDNELACADYCDYGRKRNSKRINLQSWKFDKRINAPSRFSKRASPPVSPADWWGN